MILDRTLVQDIEQAIRDIIKDIYKKEYTGKITVEKLNPIGYSISLYLLGRYVPMTFCAELDDEKFLDYLRKDLRTRNFHLQWYGVVNKREPYYD